MLGAIIGGGLAAGGIGASIAGGRQKVKPRQVYYGGSEDALNSYRDQYAQGQKDAQGLMSQGLANMGGVGSNAGDTAAYGSQVTRDALSRQSGYDPTARGYIQNSMAAANDAARIGASAQLDRAMRQNTALAATGGALGRRQAMAGNAMASAMSAQDLAAIQAQNTMAGNQALANQVVTDQQLTMQQRGQALQEAGLGNQMTALGYGTQLNAYQPGVQAGMMLNGDYLDAQMGAEGQQTNANLMYERMRQEAALNKQNGLFGMGGAMLGAGGALLGGGR